MFERFTEEARSAVFVAQEEARKMGAPMVGTAHLLLGVLETASEPIAKTLADNGLTATEVRRKAAELVADPDGVTQLDADVLAGIGSISTVSAAVEETFGPGALDASSAAGKPGRMRFDKSAKRTLQLGVREAVALGSARITSGVLLLGLLCEGDDGATTIMRAAGVDPNPLRDQIVALVRAQLA